MTESYAVKFKKEGGKKNVRGHFVLRLGRFVLLG